MVFVTVGFKGGQSLSFHCDELAVDTQAASNTIINFKWKNMQEFSPLFIDVSEIQYIIQHMPKDMGENNHVYEWPGPVATKPAIGFNK